MVVTGIEGPVEEIVLLKRISLSGTKYSEPNDQSCHSLIISLTYKISSLTAFIRYTPGARPDRSIENK